MKEDCTVCFRIACKKCGWVANDKEVQKIQKGAITACPVCRWKPEEEV